MFSHFDLSFSMFWPTLAHFASRLVPSYCPTLVWLVWGRVCSGSGLRPVQTQTLGLCVGASGSEAPQRDGITTTKVYIPKSALALKGALCNFLHDICVYFSLWCPVAVCFLSQRPLMLQDQVFQGFWQVSETKRSHTNITLGKNAVSDKLLQSV